MDTLFAIARRGPYAGCEPVIAGDLKTAQNARSAFASRRLHLRMLQQ